jgi:hypothetical protein
MASTIEANVLDQSNTTNGNVDHDGHVDHEVNPTLRYVVHGWFLDHVVAGVELLGCDGPVHLSGRLRALCLGDELRLLAGCVVAARIRLRDLEEPDIIGDTLSVFFEDGSGGLVFRVSQSKS